MHMEPFSINLNQMADKGARYKRLLVILTITFAITSAGIYLLLLKGGKNEWQFLGWALYFLLYLYFGYVGYNTKMFINADDFALEYQFGFFKKVPQKIIWETVSKVKLGFTYVAFYKKSGKRKVIKIGWLPYAKVKEIKNMINSICEEKNIEVSIAEYQPEPENEEEK